MVRCSTAEDGTSCGSVCGRPLACGRHACAAVCHAGVCEPCAEVITQTCGCGRSSRQVPCDSADSKVLTYACETVCSRTLSCKNHTCQQICCQGCPTCARDPAMVSRCPCGKASLISLGSPPRQRCTDPIATCGATCARPLACGHSCGALCHDTQECPPCSVLVDVSCSCGQTSARLECSQRHTVTCSKVCKQSLSCGKHKCAVVCVALDSERRKRRNHHGFSYLTPMFSGHLPYRNAARPGFFRLILRQRFTCACGNAASSLAAAALAGSFVTEGLARPADGRRARHCPVAAGIPFCRRPCAAAPRCRPARGLVSGSIVAGTPRDMPATT